MKGSPSLPSKLQLQIRSSILCLYFEEGAVSDQEQIPEIKFSHTDTQKQILGFFRAVRFWSHHAWKCSENVWMWHLETWFGDEHVDDAGLRVWPNDLRDLFQP